MMAAISSATLTIKPDDKIEKLVNGLDGIPEDNLEIPERISEKDEVGKSTRPKAQARSAILSWSQTLVGSSWQVGSLTIPAISAEALAIRPDDVSKSTRPQQRSSTLSRQVE